MTVVSIFSVRVSWSKQALVDDPSVAPYVCGHVVGSGSHMPGTTERYTLLVNDYECGTDAVLSMAAMICKLNGSPRKDKHAQIAIGWRSKYFEVNLKIPYLSLDIYKTIHHMEIKKSPMCRSCKFSESIPPVYVAAITRAPSSTSLPTYVTLSVYHPGQ